MTSEATTTIRPPTGDRAVSTADQDDFIQVVGQYDSTGMPVVESDLVAWLLGEGRRVARDVEFFDALCWRLVGAGVPVLCITLSVFTMLPPLVGFNFPWVRNSPVT